MKATHRTVTDRIWTISMDRRLKKLNGKILAFGRLRQPDPDYAIWVTTLISDTEDSWKIVLREVQFGISDGRLTEISLPRVKSIVRDHYCFRFISAGIDTLSFEAAIKTPTIFGRIAAIGDVNISLFE